MADTGGRGFSSAAGLVLVWAGLAGAAGVALAAAAAHKVASPALATAATMLTLTAASAIGVAAVGFHSTRPCLWRAAALVMLTAASLFSSEIAFHTFTGNDSLQMLAPVGGTLLIFSWVAVAALALRDWLLVR
jgi:uncharacterized membrane protein YgdD (TMEM256/DUF423 family)